MNYRPGLKKPKHSNCRTFEQIMQDMPNPVFGNEHNKGRIIDRIVDSSCPNSISTEKGKELIDQLFAAKGTLSDQEYSEAIDLLDVVIKNNIEGGLANDMLNSYWVFNPNKD